PEGILKDIKSLNIRGAAEIGRKASLALRLYAEREVVSDREEYLAKLRRFAKRALSTRPTAVTLWSAVTRTLKDVEKAKDPKDILERIRRNSDGFIRSSYRAVEHIAEMAARRIPKDSVIMTHCNSSAAVAAIVRAHEQRKVRMVYATESRPKLQGRITARQLAEKKVPVTYIVDSAMRYYMKDVDIVIVGADTIASNGAVINKIGTSQLALIAHERRVPFLVCAESYKFSPQTFHGNLVTIEERSPLEVLDRKEFPGVKIANPVFDATPAEYIDAIVTELGVIPPSAAYEIVVSNFGIDALKSMDAKEWMIDDLE
ncbi:MAG: ribose 1,5-bisphosphate isomerase, partial [Thermoplasmata archaeon]